MNILHLVGDRKLRPDPDKEGASGLIRAVLEIARHQVELGHEAYVAAIGSESWRSEWRGVRLIGLRMTPWTRVKVNGRVLDFRHHIPYILLTRRKEFDIVHGHLYSYVRFLRARRRIIHFHADPFYKGRNNESNDIKPADFTHIARYSDAQIAVSQFIAAELERGFSGQGHVHVVYNGVDAEFFDPLSWREARSRLRRDWRVENGDVVFLFAGAIVPEKGVVPLARAFAQVAADIPCVHLAVAGTGGLWGGILSQQNTSNYEEQVGQILRDLIAAGKTHFLGKVAASEMPAVYAASDIVIVPSVWREPFPLVVLEGQAMGRPVIASKIGGLVETVNENNGILIPPGDETEMERAMSILATNPDLRQQLGMAARQQAQSFSWQRAAQQLDTIYREYLGKAP